MPSAGVLTGQLRAYAHGHSEAAEFILRETRPQLRQIAVWKLSKSRFARLSTPTDLIHDTWITRLHGGRWQVQNREHFFCLVGRAMEQVLIDMARKRMAQRRGNGAIHESLDNVKWSCQPTLGGRRANFGHPAAPGEAGESRRTHCRDRPGALPCRLRLGGDCERGGIKPTAGAPPLGEGQAVVGRPAGSSSSRSYEALRSRMIGLTDREASFGLRDGSNASAAASISIESGPRPYGCFAK